MTQFALVMTHPPDQCPTSNETIRKQFLNRAPDIQRLAKKSGVEFLAGPIISMEHKSVSIVKAGNVEAIREFLLDTGMIQWNSIEILPGVSMEEAREEIEKLKPIY
jgi:hypothetical protein